MEKEPLIITHEKKVVYVLSSHWVIQFSSFFGGMRMQTRIVKHLTKKKWHEKLEKKIDRNEIRIRRRKKNLSETRTYEMLLDESKKKWWYCIHFIEKFNKLSNDYLKNRIACVVFFDEIFFCTCVSALSLKLNKQIDEKQNERKGKKNHTLSQKYTKQTHTHTHTHTLTASNFNLNSSEWEWRARN